MSYHSYFNPKLIRAGVRASYGSAKSYLSHTDTGMDPLLSCPSDSSPSMVWEQMHKPKEQILAQDSSQCLEPAVP